MSLTKDQKQVLNVIRKFVPTEELGIKSAFYRIKGKESLSFLFVVDKENSGNSIAYIRGLSSTLQKVCGDINIGVSIYVNEEKKEKILRNLVKEENYFEAHLSKSLFAVPA